MPKGKTINIPIELLRRSGRHVKLAAQDEMVGVAINDEQDAKNQLQEISSIATQKRIKSEPKAIKEEESTKKLKTTPTVVKYISSQTNNNSIYNDEIKLVPDGYLDVHVDELDLERTLMGGQSFRWTKEDNVFTGVIHDYALKLWRISDQQVAVKSLSKCRNGFELKCRDATLKDYFRLNYNLRENCNRWVQNDPNLDKVVENYRGFRILRQDPVENVFSFICATNNNIKRISQMVDNLCKRFGSILESSETDKQDSIYDAYYEFPKVEQLVGEDVFQCLRYELGFGYRAKFITGAAKYLMEHSKANGCVDVRSYLLSLRKVPYKEATRELMKLPGVGRKVADCICLMSMDKLESVPVDCHIYDIVCRNYLPTLKQQHKTLTETVHDKIHDFFADLHGLDAGWSTSILFIAELKHLKAANDGSKAGKASKRRDKKKTKMNDDDDE